PLYPLTPRRYYHFFKQRCRGRACPARPREGSRAGTSPALQPYPATPDEYIAAPRLHRDGGRLNLACTAVRLPHSPVHKLTMKINICYHGNCFDGVSSAATFGRFYADRINPG